jgi:hypothetical protein
MAIYGYSQIFGYFLLFHPRLLLVIKSYFCLFLDYFTLGYFQLL